MDYSLLNYLIHKNQDNGEDELESKGHPGITLKQSIII